MHLLKYLLLICSFGILSYLGFKYYKLNADHQANQVLIGNLKKERDSVAVNSLERISSDAYNNHSGYFEEEMMSDRSSKRKRWSLLQQSLKDTVAQVFAQKAEFNWLEPYKSPVQHESLGSAFFISDQGELITNFHVINQAKAIFIRIPSLGKSRFEAEILGISPERDLALIKVIPSDLAAMKKALCTEKIPYLKLGESDGILRADRIMALGYPMGQSGLKSNTGNVSGRQNVGGQYYIQTDAAINHGNSGGPSLNYSGEVIGVNSAGIDNANNIGYIIPSEEVKLFLKQLEHMQNNVKYNDSNDLKLLRKPFLGVLFNSATEDLVRFLNNPEPGGFYVVDVYKNSPLAKAGVQAGDMIYEIDGYRLDMHGELNAKWCTEEKISIIDYVSRLMINDDIHLVYYRNGKKKEAIVKFTQTELAPIHQKYPGYEHMDYEVIGGYVVMPLTMNHILLLAKLVPDLVKYADLKKRMKPALIITHVMINSQASRARTIQAGSLISEINGQKVNSLKEFRKALYKSLDTGHLTVKTTDKAFTSLPFGRILQDEHKLSRMVRYTPSFTVKDLMKKAEGSLLPSSRSIAVKNMKE